MTSSEERREVAARLRKLPSDICPAVKEWAKDGLFVDADLSDEADYSKIHNAVFGCFPAEYMHPGDYEELHERLADLIDPTCHMTREFAETEFGRVFQGWLCDECMCTADVLDASEPPSYCPNCGARVVSSDGNQ